MKTFTQEDLDEYYEDEKEPIYCPKCEERGYRNAGTILGPRILMNNEPVPEDYSDWFQCPNCYYIHHYVELPKEEEIKNAIETSDNPYENKFRLESLKKRTGVTKRKVMIQILKEE